ncbi:hypothetical protein NHE_0338 [Neorickettsia helminthoeca str. Oregon]|uniref:Protoporphyrinogen IX oxidase n=2 Tax=Neorickettsia helminthoeca TaxID=33994 RepID=X5HLK5_9RICK|nr:hypothetical protein NHE_0338 [Neorickettsia helminthoeca str. Oregon]
MERRLFYYIMTPAMVASLSLGLILALATGHIVSLWLHLKFIFVGILVLLHIFFWRCLVAFREGRNHHPSGFFKLLNESVTISFIIIVILAVIKPF